jgi:exoribonuclease-2
VRAEPKMETPRQPAAEGRVIEGEEGMDVGDRVRVRLTGVNPMRGFLDFARHR